MVFFIKKACQDLSAIILRAIGVTFNRSHHGLLFLILLLLFIVIYTILISHYYLYNIILLLFILHLCYNFYKILSFFLCIILDK